MLSFILYISWIIVFTIKHKSYSFSLSNFLWQAIRYNIKKNSLRILIGKRIVREQYGVLRI